MCVPLIVAVGGCSCCSAWRLQNSRQREYAYLALLLQEYEGIDLDF